MTTTTCRLLVALVVLLMGEEAIAQANYPDRSIRIVVAFPPGGPSDIVARLAKSQLRPAGAGRMAGRCVA